MRKLRRNEIVKRGCAFCLDMMPPRTKNQNRWCYHDKCPYQELDDAKTYGEYLDGLGGLSVPEIMMMLNRT
jgi:hypothetical protein